MGGRVGARAAVGYARGVELTGGQALAQSLEAQGVATLFALPGVQLDYAFDALYDTRIRVITTRHEQAAGYMADGYARTTGRPGVCMVVPGPGLLNASAAVATAYACSSPVVCITGQIDSHAIGAKFGLLHEINQQEQVLASITKWTKRALEPCEIPNLVREAFVQAQSERPRPAGLELPPDVLLRRQRVEASKPAEVQKTPGDPDLLRSAAELLRSAERPVIYGGGGVLAGEAWAELTELAQQLEAPVVMSVDGRGALDDRDDLAHTGVTGQALVEDADVLLAVGTRFWQPARVWHMRADTKVIRIDADAAELRRHGAPAVAIQSDARLALTELRNLLDGHRPRASRRAELRARKQQATELLATFEPQAQFSTAMRRALPEDAITVNDLTQVTFYATIGFPVYAPRTFIGPGYQGTLGSAYTTALGAQAGNPERTVVAIAGDGGYMYSIGELATQRQHGLNVISVVFNDGAFGNVKRTQQQQFGGRMLGSDLVNPDFVALGRSFGIDGERVETASALEAALGSAVAGGRPALIEVSVGPMSNAWPVIAPAGGIYPVLL
jgi:acetolactate synthase I/II/III large subunit